eukprot:comp12681_c0_seq1/m.7773 comp12681_c0_seq1/g.7773  ORF comp12681_c0_seq1/g.7773 comp12681_c0_seq1/m.7773 type:complete len:200 (-) comp12681_c0_seq1:480-1079(-)
MSHPGSGRIRKEFAECQKDETIKANGIKLEMMGDSLTHLRGQLTGPPDTPYEGGVFRVKIVVPDMYPFVPPKVHFETKLWHPNVSSQTGAICLDILKDQWAAAMTLKTVLLSIQLLLANPEPSDPQDAVVAGQYLKDRAAFNAQAREWTRQYAKADVKTEEELKIEQLMEMGFDRKKCEVALADSRGNLEQAVEKLMMG